jgi:hypothetical protein
MKNPIFFAVKIPRAKKDLFYKLVIYPSNYPGNQYYKCISQARDVSSHEHTQEMQYVFSVDRLHGFTFFNALDNVMERIICKK